MTSNQNNEPKKKEIVFPMWMKCAIGGYLISVIGIYLLSSIANVGWVPINKNNAEILGVFGDFFGGTVNTLLTSIALYFIVQSYKMQKEEFKALCKANEDLSKSGQDQVELLKKQNLAVSEYNQKQVELLEKQSDEAIRHNQAQATLLKNQNDETFRYNQEQTELLKLQNKRDLTFRMLDRWYEFDNTKFREVSATYEDNYIEHQEVIKDSIIDFLDREKRFPFFYDLKLLWESNQLDENVAIQLFSERLKYYFDIFRKIDNMLNKLENSHHVQDKRKANNIRSNKKLFNEKIKPILVFYDQNLKAETSQN